MSAVSAFTVVAGRRSKFVAILLALLVAGGFGSQAGKLESVTSSDQADSLPDGAESAVVRDAIREFDSGATTPAVVVLRRDGGLTSADRAYLGRLAGDLERRPLPTPGAVAPPRTSDDGTTAVLVVALATSDQEALSSATTDLRERLERFPSGSAVAVTGPAALAADLTKVFEGADTNLLLGASLVVVLLLVLNYRSPVFWVIPFSVVLIAEFANQGIGYLLGSAGLTIDPSATGIASVLVFGAATDYALLLVARYREELRVHADRHEAMRLALRSAGPTIVASALTVVAALLTLLLASVGNIQSIGPLAATGVLAAMALTLTLLPALLLVAGRRAFWPLIPRVGSERVAAERSLWGRVGTRIARRPRPVWLLGIATLAVMALGLTQLQSSLGADGPFIREPEAVSGAKLLARAFPAGTSAPTEVIVPDPSRAGEVRAALERRDDIVAAVAAPQEGPPGARLLVTLRADPESSEAQDQIPLLREEARAAGGSGVVVGGTAAENYDLREAAIRDTTIIVPLALAVVLVILIVLLRALVLPLMIIVTVIASFAGALGLGAVAFEQVFGFTGSDASLPLLAFVFLFALGVDYTIFLTARVREEAREVSTARAMTLGLAATGAVITSAGLVLAGTFAVLAVLPLVALAQLGFVIGVGVLLDTLVVRSVIVPALVYDAGARVWWPSRLARGRHAGESGQAGGVPSDAPADHREPAPALGIHAATAAGTHHEEPTRPGMPS